jgi:hypothetical protein
MANVAAIVTKVDANRRARLGTLYIRTHGTSPGSLKNAGSRTPFLCPVAERD